MQMFLALAVLINLMLRSKWPVRHRTAA